ncbi:MAG: transglutaminase-like domain-containing protein [Gracilibacteraceae bacterium]|nr:transglutaminase-like domain-containing protein [Gracilibacteraceae bacterium]
MTRASGKKAGLAVIYALLLMTTACAAPQGPPAAPRIEAGGERAVLFEADGGEKTVADWPLPQVFVEDEAVPLAWGVSSVKIPSAPGTVVYENNKARIDASNASEGYTVISYRGSVPKIKVQIEKSGGAAVYTYNLNAAGTAEVYPFTEGSGVYTVRVLENISGTSYALAFSQEVAVELANQFLPFLYPNQYVNFTAESKAVLKATELSAGAESDLDIITKVYDYVISHVTYDHEKAATVQSGYLPVVDTTLATGKGICFDYAALMSAMLRSQGIPVKLTVGYVSGGVYHAWISAYVQNVGWVNSMIYFDGVNWKLMDPTFAANANNSKSINEFIGKGSNYEAKYAY